MRKKIWLLPIIAILLFYGCGKKEDSQPTGGMADFSEVQTDADETAYEDNAAEEIPLSDEAKPLPEFPGSEKNFVFEMNGKRYEFQATETVKLLNYHQSYDSFFQQATVSLVTSCEGEVCRMMGIEEEYLPESKSDLETVYEGSNGVIYKSTGRDEEYDRTWNNFYFIFGDFIFVLYDADNLIKDGIDSQVVFEAANTAADTIKETDAENPLSTADGQLIGEPAFDDYRFALRPSSCYYYSAQYNVDSGNDYFTEGGLTWLSMNITMKDESGEPYVVEMEFSPDSYPSISDEAENTNLSFAGYDVYIDVDSVWSGQNYVILLGSKQVLTTLHSDSESFSPEKAVEALDIIFEKM